MAIHAHKLNYSEKGVEKKEFVFSLQYISDQLRWIDQRLTMKIDNKITDEFYKQQQSVKAAKLSVSRLKNRAISSN